LLRKDSTMTLPTQSAQALALRNLLYGCFLILFVGGGCLFSTAPAFAQSFGSPTFLPVGVNTAPTAVAVGDFNGDGIPDLIVTNRGSNNVSVFLGKGDGTFAGPTNSASGSEPSSIAVADFNSDGKLDVALANNGDNTISVLFGNGDGTFQAPVNYTVGSGPISIAFGHCLSGVPGAPCLAVVNQGDNTVSVLIGKSNGSFNATGVVYKVGRIPASVAFSDVNLDGNLDVVVANNDDSTVSVLLGDGSGDFAPAINSATGVTASTFILGSVAVGDFNGDGKPDVAVVNGSKADGAVSVLLGNGDGTFTPFANYFISGTLPTPVFIAIGDFNGDGKPDLVAADLNGGMVSVLLGNGDGTFQAPVNYSDGGLGTASVAVADLNGDGKPDLVTANQNTANLSVLLNLKSTGIKMASSLNPAGYGQSEILTATVTASGTAPTGTVTFTDGTATLGTSQLISSVATLPVTGLAAGTHVLAAAYSGDTNYAGSSSPPLAQAVNQGTTTTAIALTGGSRTSTYGEQLTFSATVAAQFGGALTGTVTFMDGTAALAVVPLTGTVATFSTATLPAGTDSVSAVYSGDSNSTGSSSGAVSEKVDKAATTAVINSKTSAATYGQPVTFNASVSSSTGAIPAGSVSFKHGSTVLATVVLSPAGGASATVTTLPTGTDNVTVMYAATGNFKEDTSSAVAVTVSVAATTTTLSSAPNPSGAGQSVTFTATVSPALSGLPTGTVHFFDNGKRIGNGTLALATTGLDQATFSITTLAAGSHSITATYAGDRNFSTSTSATLTQVVQ
jgi:hypothetical protein